MQKPVLFVSSSVDDLPLARELARQLEPVASGTIWTEAAFFPGKTVVESLTETVDRCDFALVVFPTDPAYSAGRSEPRSNLIFELGLLAGRLGLERTLVVTTDRGSEKIPSDLTGVTFLRVPSAPADSSAAAAPAAAAIARVITSVGPREKQASPHRSSYFISYSWADKEFAARLHDDLERVGVRCWLDVKELRPGQNLAEQIARGIQASDKVILVLSEASVRSHWVALEVKHASALEVARRQSVLFPVRIDDAIFTAPAESTGQVHERVIADFSGWQDEKKYHRAFSKLVRDLTITSSVESEGSV